ncbi:MAG: YfcC family protein [Firmicutes bacterium]|nr:YfcC family protein [Bacillota bacterium]
MLTWIVPAGSFDYMENEDGRNIAIAGTYHTVDDVDPVGPFRMLGLIYEGMIDAADISFLVFITYASVTFIIRSGAFDGLVAVLLRIFKGNSSLVTIPLFLVVLGIGSSTVGMCEEWYPFVPVFVTIYMGMGYDAMVGLGVVALAACCGFAGAFMNPFTVGVAQGIAELPYMSGALYRIFSHVIFIIIASFFLMRDAAKVKKDPTQSVLYGTDLAPIEKTEADLANLEFGTRQKLVLVDLALAVFMIVFGVFKYGWYLSEICGIFLLMAFIAAIIMKWHVNEVGEMFAAGFKDAAVAAMMIGLSRGIVMVLSEGGIIDSFVYGLTIPLQHLPAGITAGAMLIFQTILNFFVPSGSGQAAVSMPIMAPLADLLGVTRQTAVLAYQFGDGLSNSYWPTADIVIMAGLAGIKLDKYYKAFTKMFVCIFIAQFILVEVAVLIGY